MRLPGVLVVGREARRVGGLGDLAVVDLLEGVDALARGRHGVHQMHGGGCFERVCWVEIDVESFVRGVCRRYSLCDLSFT